jgi:hypothetical protein
MRERQRQRQRQRQRPNRTSVIRCFDSVLAGQWFGGTVWQLADLVLDQHSNGLHVAFGTRDVQR